MIKNTFSDSDNAWRCSNILETSHYISREVFSLTEAINIHYIEGNQTYIEEKMKKAMYRSSKIGGEPQDALICFNL